MCLYAKTLTKCLVLDSESRRTLQASSLYVAPPICGKTCRGTTLPNPYIYAASQACTCSPPLDVTLSLTVVANQGAAFEQSTVFAIQGSVADTLSVPKQQVSHSEADALLITARATLCLTCSLMFFLAKARVTLYWDCLHTSQLLSA